MKTRFILGSALAAVLLLCGGTGKVMAQKNIDKMAAELEKRDDVAINSVTKRDSKTRKVVKVVKSFSLKDEKIGARLIRLSRRMRNMQKLPLRICRREGARRRKRILHSFIRWIMRNVLTPLMSMKTEM